ncbi:hypothetical protein [Phocaeicola plebeius]|uniref:hypothetical protein n=1 Tax=Phocaeicola plebeius TaxID=310297 RepID=UPI0026EC48E2|nr:hypothetical protein [Phocaeicola plebeius]
MGGEITGNLPGVPKPWSSISFYDRINPSVKNLKNETGYVGVAFPGKLSSPSNVEEQYSGVWSLIQNLALKFGHYSRVMVSRIEMGAVQEAVLDAPYIAIKLQ